MPISRKIKWYFLGGIFIVLTATASIFYYTWKHPKINREVVLPSDYEYLCVVNSHIIIEQLLFSKEFKNTDTGILKNMVKNAGLDFVKPLWLVGSFIEKYHGGIIYISDKNKLNAFLKETLLAKYNPEKDVWMKDNFTFYIKSDFFYAFYGQPKIQNQSNLKDSIASKLAQQDLNGIVFTGWISLPYKWSMVFPNQKNKGSYIELIYHKNTAGINDGLQLLLENIQINGIQPVNSESTPLYINIPQTFFSVFPKFESKTKNFIYKSGMDTTGIFNHSEGNFSFYFIGLDTIYTSTIGYITDEEFNRQTIVKKTPKTIPRIAGQFRNSSDLWKTKTHWDSAYKNRKLKSILGIPFWISSEKNNSTFFTSKKTYNPANNPNNDTYWFLANCKPLKKDFKILNPELAGWIDGNIATIASGNRKSDGKLFISIQFTNNNQSLVKNIANTVDFYNLKLKNAR